MTAEQPVFFQIKPLNTKTGPQQFRERIAQVAAMTITETSFQILSLYLRLRHFDTTHTLIFSVRGVLLFSSATRAKSTTLKAKCFKIWLQAFINMGMTKRKKKHFWEDQMQNRGNFQSDQINI